MFHPLPPHTIRVRDTGSTTDKSNLRLSYVAFAITSILFSPYDQPRGPELVELVAPSQIALDLTHILTRVALCSALRIIQKM